MSHRIGNIFHVCRHDWVIWIWLLSPYLLLTIISKFKVFDVICGCQCIWLSCAATCVAVWVRCPRPYLHLCRRGGSRASGLTCQEYLWPPRSLSEARSRYREEMHCQWVPLALIQSSSEGDWKWPSWITSDTAVHAFSQRGRRYPWDVRNSRDAGSLVA